MKPLNYNHMESQSLLGSLTHRLFQVTDRGSTPLLSNVEAGKMRAEMKVFWDGAWGTAKGNDFNDPFPSTGSSFLSLDPGVQAGSAQSPW